MKWVLIGTVAFCGLLLTSCSENIKSDQIDLITGCWSINQSNSEIGSVQLLQEGTVITGVSNWATHSNGPISGTIIGDSLSFTITYPEGAIGYYYATVSENGNAMINCLAQSSSGGTALWEAVRIACTLESYEVR